MRKSIIERQIKIIHTILSDLAEDGKNGSEDFICYASRYFGFETNFGWNILMNAIYVFEDTELAKKDFEKFGFQGPSRHENIGEKYLRLYGILNSFYQQALALINLIEIFKLKDKKLLLKKIKEHSCIELRNKIAAHPTNYLSDDSSSNFDLYEISRPDLENGTITLLKNQSFFEEYNLENSINNFNEEVQEVLSKILGKFIKKKFNNKGSKYEEYMVLEMIRKGAIEGENVIYVLKSGTPPQD